MSKPPGWLVALVGPDFLRVDHNHLCWEKPVIEVEANGVCDLGGSVRCLTWQLTGDNAEKLIMAARED